MKLRILGIALAAVMLLAVCAAASVFPICSAWKADSSETSEALWDLPAHPARFARSMPQRSTDRILFFMDFTVLSTQQYQQY